MSKLAAGAISIFIAINGWLIVNAKDLTSSQATMLIISIAVIMGVSIYGVYSRYKEFCAIASMIVRIEMAMKIYEIGVFIDDEPLYELEHMNLGKDNYEHSKNIFYSHASVIFIFGILSIALGVFGLTNSSS